MPRSSVAVRRSVTPPTERTRSSGASRRSLAVKMRSARSLRGRRRPTPHTSSVGSLARMSVGSSGITNTPSGSFFPMWLAILARVLVLAKPTPQGMPTHWRTCARTLLPYSKYQSLFPNPCSLFPATEGGQMNASSMEYCSTSTALSRSTWMMRREMSPYSS